MSSLSWIRALALCITRPWVTMVLTMQDKWVLLFHEEAFQLPAPPQCWSIIPIHFYVSWNKFITTSVNVLSHLAVLRSRVISPSWTYSLRPRATRAVRNHRPNHLTPSGSSHVYAPRPPCDLHSSRKRKASKVPRSTARAASATKN